MSNTYFYHEVPKIELGTVLSEIPLEEGIPRNVL